MAKYQIWDRKTDIQTPTMRLTPEQFMERYAWTANENAIPVISTGIINGAVLKELNNMKAGCERQGASFAEGLTNEELLEAIEAWEYAQSAPITEVSDATRTADALEDLVLLQELAMDM